MKGKKEVIDILNEALKLELGAVNQYWLHYRMLDNWGYTRLGKKERKELIEEMHHADKLVDAHPLPGRAAQSAARRAPDDRPEHQGGAGVRPQGRAHRPRHSTPAPASICRKNEDLVSMKLFEELLKDEEGHIDFLETQLDLLDKIGVQNYGQLNSDPADEVEGH